MIILCGWLWAFHFQLEPFLFLCCSANISQLLATVFSLKLLK